MVRRANAPAPPEHSLTFRVATAVAVVAGILSCASVGEVSAPMAAVACTATVAGMGFSYATRRRPWQWVKLLLALAVLGVFVSFVLQVLGAAHTGQLTSIEVPLAALFTWVQVIHSFDVPARRDLLFSLAAAGALVTVAAAQAQSVGFLGYVVVWLGACLVALACSWRSMAGGAGRISLGSVVATGLSTLVLGALLLTVLPAPRAAQSITLPASLISYLPLPSPGSLTGGGAHATEPAQPGRPGGPTGVGGYLGFAGALDTAARGALGNEVVMRVRADRPGYFLGMTFDTWDGQSWTRSRSAQLTQLLSTGSPFDVSQGLSDIAARQTEGRPGSAASALGPGVEQVVGTTNVQTFYVEQPLANLLFATAQPNEVYFPAHSIVVGADGSLRSTVAMTPGTVYTVVSSDADLPPGELAKVTSTTMPGGLGADLQLPRRYQRVAALTGSILAKAHARTIYAKVSALEGWMATHVRYSTDIPPLLPGQDAVDHFLFGSRIGYCEQISTALAVMLRTQGIPAREAVGYVPGPFNPLSDLYEIQAKDAHAWVQVWFPGIGWQSFDPTAQVPLAPPDPGAVLLSYLGRSIVGLPWTPIGAGLGLVAGSFLLAVAIRRRRRVPLPWAARMAAELERRGAKVGVARRGSETLAEYLARLGACGRWRDGPDLSAPLHTVAGVLERAAYAGKEPDLPTRAVVEEIVAGLRPARGPRRALAPGRLRSA